VVAIDNRCEPEDPRLQGARLVHGDCRQREVLEQAGLASARGVLILTSDDLVNISTVLMVRLVDPNVRVVVRLFNQNLIPRLAMQEEEAAPHLRWAGWVRRQGRVVWRTLAETDRAVRICTGVLLTVVLTSTLIYHFGVKKTLPDGLYRTISVIATGGDMHEDE